MFRKPPRRNFRGRRKAGSSSSSSEAEPEPEPSSGCQGEPREAERDPDRPHRRRGARPARAEEDGSAAGLGSEAPPPLSFREGDERDGDEEHFKIKKPAVNTITFRTQKKENPDSASKQNETSQANVQSEFGTLNTKHNSEEDEEDEHNSSASVDYSSSTSGSQSSSSPDREDFSAGKIPDAATSLPLRRKRQLARSQGNYIPLNTSHGDRLFQQKGSSDSESEDESDKKIHLAPRTKSLRERMSEHIVSRGSETSEESQDDDAQNKWEEQQIKKAIKLHKGIPADMSEYKSQPVKIKFDPSVSLPPINLEIVKKRLTRRISLLRDVYRSHQREYEKYTQDVESSKTTVQKLEKSSDAALNYKFYRSMKTYVENLVDCLNEKILHINELESAMHALYKQQAQTLLKRRQEDLRNESAYLQLLSSRNVKSTNSSLEEDERAQQLLEDCEARRICRRQVRENSGKCDHHEGMSSDDERSPAQLTDLQNQKDDILHECKKIFEDVHKDYCSIRSVLLKFQQWRENFSGSYYDAYISLCLPKLLSPLIRIQLIDWNPLEDCMALEEMPWFRAIEEFSDTKHVSESKRDDDSDQNILPAVFEKTIFPKITDFVEHVWDPLSSSQTNSLVQFCKNTSEKYSFSKNESSKAQQGLMNSIVSRMKKSIEEDVFIPLYPKSTVEDKISPHSKFQERQFWSAVKLLSNILFWDGIIPEDTLKELGLCKLLNRYLLLIILNTSSEENNVEKCSKVLYNFEMGRF